ncbi:NAD(P)H:quinone oxidoreductase [Saccharopolyspora taberi]|uniref:NAD(P)H:quinone oxidoreductase n=1 Tax=Saccharopolyspora taberi TaxID=60895 RepID=A0ABN3VKV2_9PSEU
MTTGPRVAVIYYSSTGTIYGLAQAALEGAREAGADVRLRRVAELAPREVVESTPEWLAHANATQHVEEATLDDLTWADAIVFGTPTRYGNMAAQMKQFIDTTGGLWAENLLADKVVSGLTSAGSVHGGQETTLTSMYHVFMHWGAVIVPPGYTDPCIEEAGGNPYGVSSNDGEGAGPAAASIVAARYLGRRVTEKAALLSRPAVAAEPASV